MQRKEIELRDFNLYLQSLTDYKNILKISQTKTAKTKSNPTTKPNGTILFTDKVAEV